MGSVWFEICVIGALLVVNGALAMTEIAVVSVNKARIRQLAHDGVGKAKAALRLVESPNRFLATVQIGITLVGILAGAFGGARIADVLAQMLDKVPGIAPYSDPIALGLVVLVITFFSLLIGELVPKRIGLGNPEGIAMAVAAPMNALSIVSSPVVKLLDVSTEFLLRWLPIKLGTGEPVSEEGIKVLMQEGLRSGAFNKVESKIVEGALQLDQLRVRDVMTPRLKITWLGIDEPHESAWRKIVLSGHTFFPVFEGTRDNVVGIVSVKSIYANLAAGLSARIRDLMVDPLVVPATQTVLRLLDTFRRSKQHNALVANEFGGIEGWVSLTDVMRAIVGDFPSLEERAKPIVMQRSDGTWLVDGLVELDWIARIIPDFDPYAGEFENVQTLAGFVLLKFGRIPGEGDKFEFGGFNFEVIDMDRQRVDKILVSPIPAPQESGSNQQPGSNPQTGAEQT